MFFKQVRRNAAKNRKNNGLFFSSLIIAIIAFYTLLSLEAQDVMRFLKTIESDAVGKLLDLIPFIYIISLFFVFFLVYFAYRYQLNSRRREFGLYLMLGMKKSALFTMLMGETVWNSLVSVLLGLPIALLLTEIISLATSKLIGLGIIGHRISFSIPALFGTVAGFIAVQMIAMLVLSAGLSHKKPVELLRTASPKKQVSPPRKLGWLCLILGPIFLLLAYAAAITKLRSFDPVIIALILALGASGTFLSFQGIGVLIGHRILRKAPNHSGLYTFSARQIQENVLHQHRPLAVSSLLLLMALSCVSFGIGIASARGSANVKTSDFSISASEQELRQVLDAQENRDMISIYYPMFLGSMNTDLYDLQGNLLSSSPDAHIFSWDGFTDALASLPETDLRNNVIDNFSNRSSPYLISQTSYNHLLKSIGNEPLHLEENQAAFYTSMNDSVSFIDTVNGALKSGAYIEVDGQKYTLLPKAYYDNVVADRKITLHSALIVSDEHYRQWLSDSSLPFCWNVMLSQQFINEKGLMQAILLMEQKLEAAGLEYESYFKGIGRNLFYTVAASYLSIYLGILFMVIANTVIGLKYLLQQRADKPRYLTLLMLGAGMNDLCASAKAQIRLFFALALGVAACSCVFAIWSMFTSFLKLPAGASAPQVILTASVSLIVFIMIEYLYVRSIEHTSRGEIQTLRIKDRGSEA